MGIEYPIAIDNEYVIWRAFRNQYWPALFFVDAHGPVRDHHFGEGKYEQSERMTQKLLAEASGIVSVDGLVSVAGSGVEAPADWGNMRSPENYLGFARTKGFVSPGGGARLDRPQVYSSPARLALNQWGRSSGSGWSRAAWLRCMPRTDGSTTASARATCIS